MSWKKIILDFINYAFLILLVSFSIAYFFVGDRIAMVSLFLKSLVPISFFGVILLIKIKISRNELFRAKKDREFEMVIRLRYFDKFINEIIIFSIPIVILGIALLGVTITYIDILQACVAFLMAYSAQKYILNNKNINK